VTTISQAWIDVSALSAIEREASRCFPLETGGLLIGYVNDAQIVITTAIGPGPHAVHRRYSFAPDAAYQEGELARHYSESARTHTYLGDWHTHPNGMCALSQRDRRTLARIAGYTDARIRDPVMLLLAGGPDRWQRVLVRLERRHRLGWITGRGYVELTLATFESNRDL
jgi:integrative and conjugative element protein (TIGR02256 family)